MGKAILILCIATLMWACGGPKVVGNTYAPLGDAVVKVDESFEYLGDFRYYQDVYYSGERRPYTKRAVNASIFLKPADPKQLLLITRWSADGRWATPGWSEIVLGDVTFWDRAWVNMYAEGGNSGLRCSAGGDFSAPDAYFYSLRMNQARNQYNVYLYVEKSHFQSDDCPEVKAYLQKKMREAITVSEN